MAGKNIKGITIEIDGNTSKLEQSLSGVEKKSKNTNQALREIEKSLKFNPGNTVLVEQQQKKLGEAILNTKEKLAILKEADKQAKDQLANGKLGQDQYDALQREILATENSLKSYESRLEGSKNEQSKLKESTQKLKDKLVEQSKTTDDLADVMGKDFVNALEKGEGSSKDIEKAIDSLSKEMEEGSDKSKEMADSFAGFAGVSEMFSGLKDVIKNAIGAISEAWKEVDDGLDAIVAKTGATGEASAKLGQEYKDIYSTMNVSSAQVATAIGEVNTQFELQGDALEDASRQLLMYSKINGTDIANSTQQAKKAISQFNLESKDLTMVLDSVTKAGQDTGVSVDAIFDKVTQGAPTLQSLGLGFEESVTLMSQFEQSGFDSSKMLGMLTKAQAVSVKEGKTLIKTLEEFSKKAKTSKNETKLLEEANQLFGAKGGAMMVKAVKEGKLSLDDLAKASKNASGVVAGTYGEMQDPVDKFGIAQNNLKLALADVGDVIQKALAPAISYITGLIQEGVKWFTGLDENTKTIIVTIGGVVAGITAVITVVGLISAAISALSPIIAGVTGAFTAFGGAISGLFTFVAANPIVLIIGAIVAAVALLIANWDWVKEQAGILWAKIKEVWEGIKKSISDTWEAIKQTTINIWNGIKDSVKNIVDTVKNTVVDIFIGLKNRIFDIWNGIKSTIMGVWGGIKSGVSGAVNAVKGTVTNVFEGVKNTVTGIWNGIKTAITSPIETAKNTVKRIVDKIKGFFSFKFEWPKIPMPHFAIRPDGWRIGDLLKGSIPHLGIDWYAEGGVFDKPSVVGIGEAGSEAVLPTHKLDAFLKQAVDRVVGKSKESTSEKVIVNNYFTLNNAVIRDDKDIEKIAQALMRLQEKERRRLA